MTVAPTSLPELAPGDVYLYGHANGAVFLRYGDGRSMLVPLAEAVAVAEGCVAAGCRVVVGHDDAPLAVQVLDALDAAGVASEAFGPATPPHSWNDGTDALIEAASVGTDRILDDLVARGAASWVLWRCCCCSWWGTSLSHCSRCIPLDVRPTPARSMQSW